MILALGLHSQGYGHENPENPDTAIKPLKAACQFAADDILLYEFCYYYLMDLLHHFGRKEKELSPLQISY